MDAKMTQEAAANINLDAKLAEADLYREHGLLENAQQIYQEILTQIGENQHPLKKAVQSRLQGETAEVATQPGQQAKQSAPIDKNSPQYRFENCIGLMEAGFYADAIDELKLILKEGHRPGAIHAKIGECCLALEDTQEALNHLKMAAGDATSLGVGEKLDVLDKLADTYENSKAIPEAISSLEKLVSVKPEFRNAAQRLKILKESYKKYGPYYLLIKGEYITPEELDRAKQLALKKKKQLASILVSEFDVEKLAILETLSTHYKCPYVMFSELEVGTNPSCIKGIKEHFWRQSHCIPYKEENGIIKVATEEPTNSTVIDNLRSILKSGNIELVISLRDDIDKFIDYFHGKYDSMIGEGDEDVFGELELVEEQEEEQSDDDNSVGEAASDGVVVKVANKIIEEAYTRGVSDIHIESLAGKRGALVRFRVDGDCHNYQTIPFSHKRALVSRFKILSRLDIAEKRMPQDGKIKFKTRTGRIIELRVATLPTAGGNEDVVLRILAGGDALPLKSIGLLEDNLQTFINLLSLPYGLILVVGPTGSGKTTTLHAGLGYINKPEKKIWTVEDPVEIMQDGLRQVQVHSKIELTFARVLRAFLRADPDVIMVGETRDKETADAVIEASLTGHLVFSTLHTNSAPETITRLLGMGMDPYNFADSLLGVLAQRLVKRLCPHCRQPYKPTKAEKEMIIKDYGEHPTKPLDEDLLYGINLYKPKGCPHCSRTGYKGRLAIHELLVSDDSLKILITDNASVGKIREQAFQNGMRTLKQDGIMKAIQGDTDFSSVSAACIK